MLRSAAVIMVWLFAASAGAVTLDEPLPDPVAESRAHEISRSLRCLVCQNQSIEDSNAPLARDLRRIVRDRIAAGDSDDAVRQYLVDRYGEWVLLKPPFNWRTAALWIAPFLLFVAAAGGVATFLRRMSRQGARTGSPTPLNADEQARLRALLDERGT